MDFWDDFASALASTPPGNEGTNGMFFFQPEITPLVRKTGWWISEKGGPLRPHTDFAPDVVARALAESRFLAMRRHGEAMGLARPRRFLISGGASSNSALVQILSDAFGVPVWAPRDPEATAMGGAVRALHAVECKLRGSWVAWEEVWGERGEGMWREVSAPRENAHRAYGEVIGWFGGMEGRERMQ